MEGSVVRKKIATPAQKNIDTTPRLVIVSFHNQEKKGPKTMKIETIETYPKDQHYSYASYLKSLLPSVETLDDVFQMFEALHTIIDHDAECEHIIAEKLILLALEMFSPFFGPQLIKHFNQVPKA